ncbi:COX15/CtaA family protein [Spongiactinospora sp. TRM90649]|uniref:COX15/CtaA family protein n=1 Tax=Spongiactinospora sp. TRM90649 TaxID=3031114 RepID=UPI0023F653AC|nr:COX15/CtaA family protein [Spongiactinospora sp. TRM90649]MDF5753725.1 COX15/CtaA family protein [Spongiactinospora sp. TRM90649]
MTRIVDRVRDLAHALFHSFWTPTPATLRRWAVAAIVANAGITVTGVVVRVTESGLGCPTWPRCTPDSFLPVAHPEISPINTAIEFGNRLMTFLVLAAGAACLLAALRLAPRRPALVRLAWLQPLGVAAQALWGGLVVRSALNPVTVGMHFLISIGLIAACYAFYARSREGDGPPVRMVHRDIRVLAFVLVAAVFVLVVAGVVVTGSGPHSGDEAASRFGFDLEMVARLHADAAYAVVGLTFALLFALHVTDAPGRARRAALVLLGVELAQGVIGYVQYFTAVPAALVALHALGATLVWIATLRVLYMMRSRGPLPAPVTRPLDAVPA